MSARSNLQSVLIAIGIMLAAGIALVAVIAFVVRHQGQPRSTALSAIVEEAPTRAGKPRARPTGVAAFPGPWDPALSAKQATRLALALGANDLVPKCKKWVFRSHLSDPDIKLVYCNPVRDRWVAYRLDLGAQAVDGPFEPFSTIPPPGQERRAVKPHEATMNPALQAELDAILDGGIE
ncbi:MAG: hypothetical protein AAF604_08085 [Acidobacteriota bacterium]